jgi:long-chain acyl-CoA synthetase
MSRLTTLQSLVDALPRFGSRRAVGLQGELGARWWTYRELHGMAHRAAHVLARCGVARGQRMILWAPNSPEWVAFLLGAALRGVVVVPVPHDDPPQRVMEIARLTDAVFLVDDKNSPLLAIPRHDLFDLGDSGVANEPRAEVAPDDPAVILFTSGSTGEPRGVVLTHANLLHQAAPFARFRLPLRVLRMRMLALSPLSHVQGLVVGLLIPLSLGMIVLYTGSVAPAHLIRTIRAARIRFLSTVPRILDLLEQELRATATRRGPLARPRDMIAAMGRRFRAIVVGGATLPAEREAFWRASGCFVVQGYGLTETSALATINLPLFGRAGSIGTSVHDGAIRLADDGEILVRGAHVATSFVGPAPEVTADGFLRTGDLARRDRRNRLFFLGRKSDVIVTAEGHNVHPASIESLLLARPEVRDAVVINLAREGLEELHAVLLLDAASDAGAVVQQTNARLAPHQRIRSWTVWPERDFPRGVLQKADRARIARAIPATPAADGGNDIALSACAADPDPGRRVERLAAYFATHPDDRAAAAERMRDLGLDSVDLLRVLGRLQAAPSMPRGTMPAEPIAAYDRPAPSWPFAPGLGVPRALLRRALLDPLLAARFPLRVAGLGNLRALAPPCIFAVAPADRAGRLDFLLVDRALPSRFRRRLMFVMATRPSFASYLDPEVDATPLFRAFVGLVFHLGVPLFMPFTLFPTMTRAGTLDGLRRACMRLDRGFAAVSAWGRGTAIMATECQIPVVPVRIQGRRPAAVSFGAAIDPSPSRTADDLHALVLQAFDQGSGSSR